MKLIKPPAAGTFIPGSASLMVACPKGCVRGKAYFDTNALLAWLRDRNRPTTAEHIKASFRCGICGERPVEVRVITLLYTHKLAALPGMPEGGRAVVKRGRPE